MNRIVAILSVIGLLTACGEGVPDADFTYAAGQEHNHLDPVKMSWSHDIRLAHCLYDTLVVFDFNDFVIRPGAAERWERSDDGLILYVLHPRQCTVVQWRSRNCPRLHPRLAPSDASRFRR